MNLLSMISRKPMSGFTASLLYNNLNEGLHILHKASDHPKIIYLIERFITLYGNSLKVYLPVHIVTLLLRLKRGKQSIGQLLKRGVVECMKSAMFATCFAMSIPVCYCYYSTWFPRAKQTWMGNLVAFTFSWAILWDSNSRWAEMSLYVLAQWFEGFVYSLHKRRYLPTVPHWEKLVLALAFGIIASCYFERDDSGTEKHKLDFFFKFILGDHSISSSISKS